MLITRYCNLIGTANIPAVHTKTCPNTPDVFSPLPSFRRAQYTCARKIRLARETKSHQEIIYACIIIIVKLIPIVSKGVSGKQKEGVAAMTPSAHILSVTLTPVALSA